MRFSCSAGPLGALPKTVQKRLGNMWSALLPFVSDYSVSIVDW